MIEIVGNIWGSQGYAVHTRSLANALNKITEVKLSTDLINNWQRIVSDEELKMIKRQGESNARIIIGQPNMWRMVIGNGINIGFLVFEGDKIPKCWLGECLNPDIDMIFVPSEHTKQAILNTLFEYHKSLDEFDKEEEGSQMFSSGLWHYEGALDWDKIKVIPHGVDINLFKPSEVKKDKFRFLCNKGFRNEEDRGGIQYAIKAFIQEFKKDEAELILKINPAYPVADIQKIAKEYGLNENTGQIRIIPIFIEYKDMPKIYNECNVFVAPTRAEAFNIPCVEAMACGKPVITTNFGGQTDYVDQTTGWLVGGDLGVVEHELLYEETKWLTPDIGELRKAMRDAYEDVEKTHKFGKNARKKAEEYTWEKTAQNIVDLLKERMQTD